MRRLRLVLLIFMLMFSFNTYGATQPMIRMDDSVPNDMKKYVTALISEVNKKHPQAQQHYVFYTANFSENQHVPEIPQNDEIKNIIWLGSAVNFQIQNIADYDVILASTPLMQEFLKKQGVHSFYLPVFGLDSLPSNNQYKYIALIGRSPLVENELIKRKIFYRQYKTDEWEKIRRDMSKFKAVFIDDGKYALNSLDIAPVFLEMALMNIPMITQYNDSYLVAPKNVTLLNDTISYYQSQDDLTWLFDKSLLPSYSEALIQKIHDAHDMVQNYFSVAAIAEKLDYILLHQMQQLEKVFPHTLNFDIPVSVGHIGAGDYWLVQDLNDYFNRYNLNTSVSFFNSKFVQPAEVNVIVAGFLPKTYTITRPFNGTYNIVYVAYGQFPQHGDDILEEVEDVVDNETYLAQLEKLYRDDEVQALILASKSLTETLNQRGVPAYYIPQFTNIKRFYPDYDESVKSEVFFVGKNSFYRKAVPALLKAGLPVTVYGPYWDKGVAKGEYLDNRLLYKYYSSAKIVLNDTREGMKKYGFVSNRIYDATACGALVISDYMPEIEEIYGDSVPMWKTEEELIELVKYYLNPEHEQERKEKAERARQITLKNFTSDIAARQFLQIFDKVKNNKN